MKEQFVTYELALELKKLGFDEECFGYFNGGTLYIYQEEDLEPWLRSYPQAPLWQQAFYWLLWKLKHISIEIIYSTAGCELIVENKKVNQQDTKEECLKKLIEIVKNYDTKTITTTEN